MSRKHKNRGRRRKKGRGFRSANYDVMDDAFLSRREESAARKGYGRARWIEFCRIMMGHGLVCLLYEAPQTWSKYVSVGLPTDEGNRFKVRFSDHKPIRDRELNGDCDFFVGKTHTGYRNTDKAIEATLQFFSIPRKEVPLAPVKVQPPRERGPSQSEEGEDCGEHLTGPALERWLAARRQARRPAGDAAGVPQQPGPREGAEAAQPALVDADGDYPNW